MDDSDDLVLYFVTILVAQALKRDDEKKILLDTFYSGLAVRGQLACAPQEECDKIRATVAVVRSQFIDHLKNEQAKLNKETDGE